VKKPNKYVDVVFLILLGLSLCLTFYRHFADGYVISINNILALILFVTGVFIKIKNSEKGKYVVLILLLLATLNIINFTIGVGTVHIGNLGSGDESLSYAFPGIDPLFFLILLIYWIINKKAIRSIWDRIYHGSEKEQVDRISTGIDFYYNKFNAYNEEGLNDAFKMYKDYPVEAKEALKKIHQERNLSLMEF